EAGPYYTMELVDGMDMAEAAPLSPKRCCLFLRDVATSLALLHARRLVHRDVSAANVRATASGHCKLLDFGTLAPFGYVGVIAGTPPFIAPEAIRAGSLDQRADLFALGALAYWMLTAQHAFPAQRLEDLRPLWRMSPPAPSTLRPGIPPELDALVLSLLSMDPLARPTSAAEVIATLEAIGELPSEDPADAESLAQSFLANPRFVGRKGELSALVGRLDRLFDGRGGALRIEAISGMGRTRLLEEVALRAQVKGALVVRVDATAHRQPLGVARAMAERVLDLFPELARASAEHHRGALAALGDGIRERLGAPRLSPDESGIAIRGASGSVTAWFEEMSRDRPMVVTVDDVECADEASFGLLTSLASASTRSRLLLVVTERAGADPSRAVGLRALRSHCESMSLPGLGAADTLELTRSVFGEAPNAARFAEWMHERTAGSALHFIAISRHLAAKRVARYVGGAWVLPAERPDSDPPQALEDALAVRLSGLGEKARALAECLALQRARRPTLELCRLLVDRDDRGSVLTFLDELERENVVYADADGYRFSSLALSEALLRGMTSERRAQNHRRLGAALLTLPNPEPGTTVEAGWHLIQGGDELAGAEHIASVTSDGAVTIRLLGNLHQLGNAVQATLRIFERHSVSKYRRLPLLAALSYASYYEDRKWGELYGDQTLDALEDVCGLRTARRVARLLGPALGLVVGVVFAFIRYRATRRRDRGRPFGVMFQRLFGVVTTLAGVASLSLDSERVRRIADVLSPFAVLPEKMAPVGMHRYCLVLGELGRERPAAGFKAVEALLASFQRPDFYPTLPAESRRLFVAGLQFLAGTFAVFSSNPNALARHADALDATGLKLYAMIASQLRTLHHANRGELAIAARHREQVEFHAAHVGSAWQAELWEGAPLFVAHVNASDVAGMMHIAGQEAVLAASAPSAATYPRLARLALRVLRGDRTVAGVMATDPDLLRPPRSFLGWSSTHALLARAYNQAGEHAKARSVAADALALTTPEDLKYAVLFLGLELELAHADAGLGDVDGALERLDALLDVHSNDDNPLVKGLLHEARALVCLAAGRTDGYTDGVDKAERSLRPIGTPSLIAKCERLASRGRDPKTRSQRLERISLNDQVATISAAIDPEES
ncbi:MAG TPA: AAA family ATPase, partial [Polyangiaceae bacterium]|nr:AAA family ATPase [Polyangiaceae bacterium]